MCVGFKLKFDNCKHISSNPDYQRNCRLLLVAAIAWIINSPSRSVLYILHPKVKYLIFLIIEQDVNLHSKR